MITDKKKNTLEILLHLLFWAGVFYVLTSLDTRHILMPRKGPLMVSDQFRHTPYVYCILIFLAALFYGNILWVFKKAISFRNIAVRLAVCLLWFALVFGGNYLIAGPMFNKANKTVEAPGNTQAFQKDHEIKQDVVLSIQPDHPKPPPSSVNFMVTSWNHLQPVILLAFLVILGISIAYFFLKEWTKSELIQTQLRADRLSNEVKFLKSQINPHFLFNTLNNLFSMAQARGNEELADGIHKLSGMMSYMLYDSNADTVPLSTEITYLEECITLNKLRYADDEVVVKFDHPSGSNISIAPMLFIPFVENAFKHGTSIGQATSIEISIELAGKKLLFSCINDNYSNIKKMEIEKGGIGLENVKRRLALLYPGNHQLQTKEADKKYMITLEINLA